MRCNRPKRLAIRQSGFAQLCGPSQHSPRVRSSRPASRWRGGVSRGGRRRQRRRRRAAKSAGPAWPRLGCLWGQSISGEHGSGHDLHGRTQCRTHVEKSLALSMLLIPVGALAAQPTKFPRAMHYELASWAGVHIASQRITHSPASQPASPAQLPGSTGLDRTGLHWRCPIVPRW
jgi:hypothetical protein